MKYNQYTCLRGALIVSQPLKPSCPYANKEPYLPSCLTQAWSLELEFSSPYLPYYAAHMLLWLPREPFSQKMKSQL